MILSLALSALLGIQDPDPRLGVEADLGEIVVEGQRLTRLLTVTVLGDADNMTLVSAENDLRCGPAQFRWEDFGRPRQCWMRRLPGHTVVLTPSGHTGRTVDWQGCASVRPDGSCEVRLQDDTVVTATFRRG